MNGTPSNHNQISAWRILVEVEAAFGAMRLACGRCVAQKQAPPESIADYRFWIENGAGIQQVTTIARALNGVAGELRRLGFTPSVRSPSPSSGVPSEPYPI